MTLNPKQKAFVEAYIANGGNGTQAVIAAGYSPNGADVQAVRLLGNASVSAALEKRTAKVVNKLEVTTERIIQERARLAFYNPMKLAGIQTLEQLQALDEDTQRAVQAVKILPDGTLEIKAADKDKSLAALEKINGMYREEDKGEGALNIHIHF